MNSRAFQYMICRSNTGRHIKSIRELTRTDSYFIHWDNCWIHSVNENYWFPIFPWRPHYSKLFTPKLNSNVYDNWGKGVLYCSGEINITIDVPQQHLGFPYRVFPLPICILIAINLLFNQNIAQHPYKRSYGSKVCKKPLFFSEKVAQFKLLSH